MRQFTNAFLSPAETRRAPCLNGVSRGLCEILRPLVTDEMPEYLTRLARKVDQARANMSAAGPPDLVDLDPNAR
jgi:hypothetical protein